MASKKDTAGIVTDKLGAMECTHCGAQLDISDFGVFDRFQCPQCDTEEVVPGKLGNFLLLDLLGKGGMGAVYLAQDQSLRRKVALKVMHRKYGQDQSMYEGFVREAQATAALNHPNVVQIYSFGQESGQPYIVMELVGGGRLDSMMKGRRRVEELDLLETAVEVIAGLSAANEAGLTHGDIKPENILYDKNGNAKVVDFGLARFIEASGGKKSEVWGTPYYIAPEKAKHKKEDARSDQYSLGATLFHALAARPPWDGETATDVVIARLNAPVPRLDEEFKDISKDTADIIARTMARQPNMRYPNYRSLEADLLKAIEKIKDGTAVYKQEEAPPPSGMIKLGRGAAGKDEEKAPGKLLPILVWVGVLLLCSVSGFFIVKTIKSRNVPPPAPPPVVKKDPQPTGGRKDTDPFLKLEKKWLKSSVAFYLQGQDFDADAELSHIRSYVEKKRPDHAALQWYNLAQATPLILSGRDAEVRDYSLRIINKKIKWQSGTAPVVEPKKLAQLLQGELSPEDFAEKAKAAPEWYRNLGGFYGALRQAEQGHCAKAIELAKPYAEKEGVDKDWGYSWQPMAKRLIVEAGKLEALLAQDKPDVKALSLFVNSSFKIWLKTAEPHLPVVLTAEERKELADKERKAAALKKKAEEAEIKRAMEAKQVAEIASVQTLGEDIKPALAAKDFQTAMLRCAALESTLTNDKAKADFIKVQQRVELQLNMQEWLSKSFRQVPYAGAKLRVGGKPTGANFEKIKFGGRGFITWEKLPMPDLASMGVFYLEKSPALDDEKANHAIGLAIYFYDQGKVATAKVFADKANELSRTVSKTVKELMPQL